MEKRKHTTSVLVCLAWLVCLCACSKDLQKTEEDMNQAIMIQVENRETAYPLSTECTTQSVARIDAHLLLLGEIEDSTVLGLAEYRIMQDGRPSISMAEQIQIGPLPFEDPIFYGVVASGDSFYLLSGNGQDQISTELIIQRYSSDGEYLDSMEIPEWDLLTVDVFTVGSGGELILGTDDTVCVYRWQEGLLQRSHHEWTLSSAALCKEGIVISGYSKQTYYASYFLVDSETGELHELPFSSKVQNASSQENIRRVTASYAPCQGLDGEYLSNQISAICLIDFENDSLDVLIEWNPDAIGEQIEASCRLSESAFACILDGKLVLSWWNLVEKTDSSVVRVGVIDSHEMLSPTVDHMNTEDSAYIYETHTFGRDDLDRFRAELVSGAFDLVLFYDEVDTSSSLFDDLYSYIDADPELSREDFLPNLLESTSVHGELHQLWNSVQIGTMIAQEDRVGDGYGLTIKDCERIVSERDDVQSILENLMSDQIQLEQETLRSIAYLSMTAFVNKEDCTCSFDSEEFSYLLSLCGEIESNPEATRKDYLLVQAQVSSADYLADNESLYGRCVYIGYPNGGDGIHYYTLTNNFENCMAMAIPTSSQNKEGAWNFIKIMLSRSCQLQIADTPYSGMPVRYDILRETTEHSSASEKDIDRFYDLLNRTKYAERNVDVTLLDLIIDNGQDYLSGTKTLKETVALIQGQASILIAEQFG